MLDKIIYNTLLTVKIDANYGIGYYTDGAEMLDYALDMIRKQADTCD